MHCLRFSVCHEEEEEEEEEEGKLCVPQGKTAAGQAAKAARLIVQWGKPFK